MRAMERKDMTEIKERLFEAFREDHALLGGALYKLDKHLRMGDWQGAKSVAAALDAQAGAHIAFEESDFYPALAPFLSASEIECLYDEHAEGCALILDVLDLESSSINDTTLRNELLDRVQNMQTHVSDCGELFGAMGGLSDSTQHQLLDHLNAWRSKAPHWSELSSPTSANPDHGSTTSSVSS